jgi:hypothetical protein
VYNNSPFVLIQLSHVTVDDGTIEIDWVRRSERIRRVWPEKRLYVNRQSREFLLKKLLQ